jgi:hypothetical protein
MYFYSSENYGFSSSWITLSAGGLNLARPPGFLGAESDILIIDGRGMGRDDGRSNARSSPDKIGVVVILFSK